MKEITQQISGNTSVLLFSNSLNSLTLYPLPRTQYATRTLSNKDYYLDFTHLLSFLKKETANFKLKKKTLQFSLKISAFLVSTEYASYYSSASKLQTFPVCPRDKKTSKQSSSQHLSVAKYPQCSFRLLFIVSMQVSYSAKQWNSAIQQVSADSLQRGLGTRLILPFYALSQLQSNWLYSIVNYIFSSSFCFLVNSSLHYSYSYVTQIRHSLVKFWNGFHFLLDLWLIQPLWLI